MKIPINKVAQLAHIKLSPEEEKSLTEDLSKVLSYVEQINSIEGLDAVEPTSHPLNSEDVFRKDEVENQASAKEVLKHAPDPHGEFFKVPKVIGEN